MCVSCECMVLVFLPVSSAVSLEVLFISPSFSSTVLLELVSALYVRGHFLFGIGLVAVANRGLLFFSGLPCRALRL